METFRKILTTIVLCFILILCGLQYKNSQPQQPQPSVGGDANVYTGGQSFYLSGTGLTSSATSIGLTDFSVYKNDGTKYELLTADVAGTSGSVFLTIEPGNSTKQEFVSCTTVTQGSGTSATLSGCSRGLLPFTPYTSSTTYAFPHNGGAKIIVSNSPAFYDQFAGKGNDETVTGLWQFNTSLPRSSLTATVDSELITLGQANLIGNQGAATSTESTGGIAELATALEAASSTDYGANRPLVLQAKYATDTPTQSTASASKIPMTDLTGYLKQGFLKLSDAFTWTGAHIFQALVTMNGAVTIAANSSNKLTLNSLPYVFPVSETASSTALMSDGSGNLSWNYPSYDIVSLNASSTVYGGTGTTTIVSKKILSGRVKGGDNININAHFLASTGGFAQKSFYVLLGNGTATTTLWAFDGVTNQAANGKLNLTLKIGSSSGTKLGTTWDWFGSGATSPTEILSGQSLTTNVFGYQNDNTGITQIDISNGFFINLLISRENASDGGNTILYHEIAIKHSS